MGENQEGWLAGGRSENENWETETGRRAHPLQELPIPRFAGLIEMQGAAPGVW